MKLCQNCDQLLAEDIIICPNCGNKLTAGRKSIDDYRIIKVLHEGYNFILCQGVKEHTETPVMLRIYSPQSGIDEKIAKRLKNELEELKKLPEDYFVRHFEIRKSSTGQWYRVSEWLDTENWGTLVASGVFLDYHVAFQIFHQIASIMEWLHRTGLFLPHLILDDILAVKGDDDLLQVKIDYKHSRFLDPKLDRPNAMLGNLLLCHPDIIHGRPLDFRCDIWSLGKIFVGLLSANLEMTELKDEIDKLQLPKKVGVLFKQMLADDPDLRPQSMAEVALVFEGLTAKEIQDTKNRATLEKNLPRSPIGWFFRPIKLIQSITRLQQTSNRVVFKPINRPTLPFGEKQTNHVFISYVRENAKVVKKLIYELKNAGVNVWYDEEIKPGTLWKDAIRNAIKEGEFFIACFSKEYFYRKKTYMNEELNLAIEELRIYPIKRAWFIPVLLSECDVPPYSIRSGETLRDIQWVNLYENWESGIKNILSVIRTVY